MDRVGFPNRQCPVLRDGIRASTLALQRSLLPPAVQDPARQHSFSSLSRHSSWLVSTARFSTTISRNWARYCRWLAGKHHTRFHTASRRQDRRRSPYRYPCAIDTSMETRPCYLVICVEHLPPMLSLWLHVGYESVQPAELGGRLVRGAGMRRSWGGWPDNVRRGQTSQEH